MITVRVIDFAIEGRRGGVQPPPFLFGPVLLQVLLQALGHERSGLHQELLLRLAWVLDPCTRQVNIYARIICWTKLYASRLTSYIGQNRSLGRGGGGSLIRNKSSSGGHTACYDELLKVGQRFCFWLAPEAWLAGSHAGKVGAATVGQTRSQILQTLEAACICPAST